MNSTMPTLHELFDYDADTGIFTLKSRERKYFSDLRSYRTYHTRYAGKIAGTATARGYRVLRVNGEIKRAHRIAWEMHYGSSPLGMLDHINGDTLDNRISNLREVTAEGNMKNTRKRTNNTSGVTGVVRNKTGERWKAQIQSKGRSVSLGVFDSKADAIAARKEAEKLYEFHENHGRT